MEEMFFIQQFQDDSLEQKLPLHIVFVNFKQEYDCYQRGSLQNNGGNKAPSKIMSIMTITLNTTEYLQKVILDSGIKTIEMIY